MSNRRDRQAPKEERLIPVFRALADPSRCKIIDLLREAGEMRVGDIAGAFEMSLNGVSKHLKVLEQAGLIHRRRDGVTHYISMRWEGIAPIVEWLNSHRHYWDHHLELLEGWLTEENK